MARAYKCDWCKKLVVNKYEAKIMPARVGSFYTIPMDICIDCGQKFENFQKEVTLHEDEDEAEG